MVMGAITDLAHALGLQVVAEGVESEVALQGVRHLGCDFAQGYHIGMPVAPSGLPHELARLQAR
jgi:EAL domain-containing protein (putative c-di-GMP-specific phosphodiesterase class I)